MRTKERKIGLTITQKILIVGIMFITLSIIIVCIVVVSMLRSSQQLSQSPQIPQTGGSTLIVDESNLAEIEDQLAQRVQDGMFEVNMNTTWHFEEGNMTSSNAYVANGNANHYDISIEVFVGEESVYSSGLIPVGRQLKEITLNRELPRGKYNGVCMYHLWAEDGTEKSSVGVDVILSIE